MNYKYTEDEICFLNNNYSSSDWDYLLENLNGHSKGSIRTMSKSLGLKRGRNYKWNEDDIELLMKYYPTLLSNVKSLVNLFDNRFTYGAIKSKAQHLGIKCREYWSEEDSRLLQDKYSIMYVDDLCHLFPHKNRRSIISRAMTMGLKSRYYLEQIDEHYKDYEIKFLINNWEKYSDEEMSHHINRSWMSIRTKRHSLGLTTPREVVLCAVVHVVLDEWLMLA